MSPKEDVLGSIPGRQSSGPKERYPGYGSLHYTHDGILLFLFLGRFACSRHNARHTPVTYGIPGAGLRKSGITFKNHPTVITDRTSGTLEHCGLVRTLNARTRFTPATYVSNARARGGMITQSC